MGQVDQADQLYCYNTGLWQIRQGGWHALWNFIFNIVLVNCYLLSSFKSQIEFRNSLIIDLINRGTQQKWQLLQSASISHTHNHKLAYRQIQQYCTICNQISSSKQPALAEISRNSTPNQRRKKSRYGCVSCDIALCKEGNCFQEHCDRDI